MLQENDFGKGALETLQSSPGSAVAGLVLGAAAFFFVDRKNHPILWWVLGPVNIAWGAAKALSK